VADLNVLVVFYSRYGNAEKQALAAGVGALRAKANIRLRRLADLTGPDAIEADSRWKENLERMNRDYVTPRPADPVWADVIVLATPADSSTEVATYVATLPTLGSMEGKIAAPLGPSPGDTVLGSVYAAAASAGLIVVPAGPGAVDGDTVGAARAYGQRVSQMARLLKAGR